MPTLSQGSFFIIWRQSQYFYLITIIPSTLTIGCNIARVIFPQIIHAKLITYKAPLGLLTHMCTCSHGIPHFKISYGFTIIYPM